MTTAPIAPHKWHETKRRLGAVVASLAFVTGCTGPSHLAQLAAAAGLPATVELERTPFHPQTEHECGPAALATVLGAAGHPVDTATLAHEVYVPGRQGALQPELAAAVRDRDLLPYPISPDLRDIMTELAAGRPVLVLQRLGLGPWPSWHYAVVVGYDATTDRWSLRSGRQRRQSLSTRVFAATWARADHWGLVVIEPGTMPTAPDVERYVTAAAGLEATGHLDAASRAYSAATVQWPQEPLPWLGLANVAALRGNWTVAEQGFSKVLALDPRQAAALNNRAEALRHLGCSDAARALLRDGTAALSPDDPLRPALAATLAQIEADGAGKPPTACVLQ